MNFIDRLEEFMSHENLRQKDIIEKSKLSKAYISMVLKGERQPNNKLLSTLSSMNGKSINWWLHGKEEYDNLYALNELLNIFIENGSIKENVEMNDDTWGVITKMLKKEINVKLKAKKEKAQL